MPLATVTCVVPPACAVLRPDALILTYWGKLVRAARQRHGWSQTELAERLNALLPPTSHERRLRRQTIQDFEQGCVQRTNLTTTRLLALFRVCQIDQAALWVDPESELAELLVIVIGLGPAAIHHLVEFYRPDGPLFGGREQRPPSPG